jgi:hypothetical protein
MKGIANQGDQTRKQSNECDQYKVPESPHEIKDAERQIERKIIIGKQKGPSHLPGNSVSEVGERMNGGAVKEDKSPENEAILINVQGDKHGWEVSGKRPRKRSREEFEPTI